MTRRIAASWWTWMGCALAIGALGCTESDDPDSPGAPSTGASTEGAGASGGAASSAGGSGSESGGSGGSGGTGTGASGGAGGNGTGGAPGLPWEGALDPNAGPSSDRFTEKQLGTTTAPQGFYEYLPGGYGTAGAKWPLLMVLHGIGENGNGTSDLHNILNTGIPPLIGNDQWPGDRPFVVVMPQHPGGGCPGAGEVEQMFTWATANYDIDPKWVFLTGLSCGAIGSWGYLAEHLDEQIAAFVPVAGDGKGAFQSKGCDLAKVAIWAFHGDADGTVNVSGTNEPMDGLAQCPKPPALETKKIIYPGVGHNSWDQTYNLSAGHDIYSWFLAHPKP